MTITVTGLKNTPHDNDKLIIKDSEDGDNLKEILFSQLGVAAVALTDYTNGVKTYTLYSDVAKTLPLGSPIIVRDGVDGAGSTWPDYINVTEYSQFMMVRDVDDGLAYRYKSATPSTGNKPQTNGTVHSYWEMIPLGGLATLHDETADYAIGDVILVNGKILSPINSIAASVGSPIPFVEGYGEDEWYNMGTGIIRYHNRSETVTVDTIRRSGDSFYQANNDIDGATSPVNFVAGMLPNQWRPIGTTLPRVRIITGNAVVAQDQELYINTAGVGTITITIAAGVSHFQLIDYGESWTDSNDVRLVVGTDTIKFGTGQQSQRFNVIRDGGVFRVYGTNLIHAEGTI